MCSQSLTDYECNDINEVFGLLVLIITSFGSITLSFGRLFLFWQATKYIIINIKFITINYLLFKVITIIYFPSGQNVYIWYQQVYMVSLYQSACMKASEYHCNSYSKHTNYYYISYSLKNDHSIPDTNIVIIITYILYLVAVYWLD